MIRVQNLTSRSLPFRVGKSGNRTSRSLAPGEVAELDIEAKNRTLLACLRTKSVAEVDDKGNLVEFAEKPAAPTASGSTRRITKAQETP